MPALLAAEGLAAFEGLQAVRRYVEHNEGTEASVLAAVREVQAAEAAAEAARQARCDRLLQLLEEEGLPAGLIDTCYPVVTYIQHNIGSEEEALQQARTTHARAQRQAAAVEALQAEGLPEALARRADLARYVRNGEEAVAGRLQAALAAARQLHAREEAQARLGGGEGGS